MLNFLLERDRGLGKTHCAYSSMERKIFFVGDCRESLLVILPFLGLAMPDIRRIARKFKQNTWSTPFT